MIYKKYLEEYTPPDNFAALGGRTSSFEGVYKDRDKFLMIGHHEDLNIRISGFKKELDAYHAYVLWCKEVAKEVDTRNYEYQEYLKEKNPPMSLEKFKRSIHKKTSRFRHVFFRKDTQQWVATLVKKRKVLYKESFDDEYEAHLAVEKKKSELKKLNII